MLSSVVLGSLSPLSPFGSGKGEELVTRQATVRHKLIITCESSLCQARLRRDSSAHYHFDRLFFCLLQLFIYGGNLLPLGSMMLRR